MPTFLRGIDSTVPLTALLVVAVLLAGVVAVVHRGSAGAPAAAGVAGAAPAAEAAAPPFVDPAADQKLAQSLVLTQLDYPDGWTIAPHEGSPAVQAQNDRLRAGCLGLPDPTTSQTAGRPW